jgi:hypothetical protein
MNQFNIWPSKLPLLYNRLLVEVDNKFISLIMAYDSNICSFHVYFQSKNLNPMQQMHWLRLAVPAHVVTSI